MKKLQKSASQKFFVGLIVVLVGLGVVHLLLQYININIRNEEFGSFYELTNRFDFDDEASIPTWVSQLLFLLISASALLLIVLEKLKARKVLWFTVSIVALVGSLDEVATLHENILQSIHLLFFDESAPTFFANAWLVIVPFILIGLIVFIAKAITILPKRTIKLFVMASLVYFTGSVFIDIMTSSEASVTGFASQGLLVAIEEMLELVGLSIALYALSDYTERKFSTKLKRAKQELTK